MPKQVIADNVWKAQIPDANKYYEEWETAFQCNTLEKYYEGQQWMSQKQLNQRPYVINKFYETMQIKIAQFLPTFPEYLVSARPANMEYDQEIAAKSATLKQDTLNSIIQDENINFVDEMEQIYKDSFCRFGVCEVGYSADWVMNPNARKPLLKGQADNTISGDKARQISQEPEEIPLNERVYFRHIPAKRFRVGGIDHRYLNRCTWVGYYDWVLKDDILSQKNLMNREKLENAKTVGGPMTETNLRSTDNAYKSNIFKVWHLWHLRAGVHLLVLDDPAVTIFQRNFKRLPLFDYRPDRRLIVDGFYPIPPSYHWTSPQDEFNETRQMLRAHRRRFLRKYQAVEGTVDENEISKFESGEDGSVIIVKRAEAITPIQDANLGSAINEAVITSADDFNRISGTSSEARGVADRTTATQAKIVDTRSAIRENKERDRLVKFFAKIGREALLVIREKFALGLWIRQASPEGESILGEVNDSSEVVKWVASEDLNDGYDFRINVDVTSLSTTAQADEEQHFLKFMGVLTQFPFIAFSPKLVREAAYRCGYRNESVIKEMQKMALLMQHGRMLQMQAQNAQLEAAAGGAGGGPPNDGNAGQQIVQQATPPQMEQIRQQLQNQVLQ